MKPYFNSDIYLRDGAPDRRRKNAIKNYIQKNFIESANAYLVKFGKSNDLTQNLE